MNKKFTMHRKFLAQAIKRMAAMLPVIALINGIYWTIYHCLCTATERRDAILGSWLGSFLGALAAFLLVWSLESIWILLKIRRITAFVNGFDTVTEACRSYGEDFCSVEELAIIFTRETRDEAFGKREIPKQETVF